MLLNSVLYKIKDKTQQLGSSREYSGGKNQAKTMKGNSNGTRFQ